METGHYVKCVGLTPIVFQLGTVFRDFPLDIDHSERYDLT